MDNLDTIIYKKEKEPIIYKKNYKDLIERIIFKITSGRFIFTVVVAGVYAYLACNSILDIDRVQEITLIVLYAYFTKRKDEIQN